MIAFTETQMNDGTFKTEVHRLLYNDRYNEHFEYLGSGVSRVVFAFDVVKDSSEVLTLVLKVDLGVFISEEASLILKNLTEEEIKEDFSKTDYYYYQRDMQIYYNDEEAEDPFNGMSIEHIATIVGYENLIFSNSNFNEFMDEEGADCYYYSPERKGKDSGFQNEREYAVYIENLDDEVLIKIFEEYSDTEEFLYLVAERAEATLEEVHALDEYSQERFYEAQDAITEDWNTCADYRLINYTSTIYSINELIGLEDAKALAEDFSSAIRAYGSDLHDGNIGILDGRLLIIDYGLV